MQPSLAGLHAATDRASVSAAWTCAAATGRVPDLDGRDRPEAGRVRALVRGLEVLREVNRSGGAKAGEVAARLQMPRPTVYRLLETLEELGYVRRSASDERFHVTRRASSLGDGYDGGVVVGQVAAPILIELGRRLVWPTDLSVYENAAMVIQETTHARSPMSIDRGMIGRRLPMLRTSAGRIYLASCSDAERDIIVRHLRRVDDPADRPFLEARSLELSVAEARRLGYASRVGGDVNARTSSLAVAVAREDTVLACISVIWITAGLSFTDAVATFIGPMREASARIAAADR